MERIPCSKCGAMILPATAQATGGICMPCKKNQDAAVKTIVPVMSDTDRADMEQMTIELIRALKYRDIQSALEYFHPDDRPEQEEMIREGLEALLADLPDGDPVFKWSKTNDGSPSLDLANSNAQWGMSWICCFRDKKWWLG